MRTIKNSTGIRPAMIASSLLLAGISIFNHITARAFWVDEADVANTISLPFSGLWHRAIIDGVPIFYSYVLKCWSLVLGDSELSLRGFSALFALLVILLLYRTADKFLEDKRIAIVAVFLASTNYFLIWFATQNKVYVFAAFLGLLSYYFFIKLVFDPEKMDHLFYIIITGLCTYTHPWLILVFFSQVLNLILFGKGSRDRRKIFFAQMATLILMIPSLLITLYQGKLGVSAWIGSVPLSAIFESFKYLCFGSNSIYLCFFMIAALYVVLMKKDHKGIFDEKESTIIKMLLVYLLFPLIAALFISQFAAAYAIGRYELIVLPAFLLLIAIWFSKIKNDYILIAMAVLLAAFCFHSVSADRDMVLGYQANDKTIAHDLLNVIRDGDTIIATDLTYPTFSYYLGLFNKDIKRRFTLLIYPLELSEHPCWENFNKMSANTDLYRKEALILAEKLSRERVGKYSAVWVLYSLRNPFNAGLREQFKKRFNSEDIVALPSPREPSWADLIIKFH
jgi:Dolichyl-phosphate-mannose-protein mannosyltransferase